MVSLVQFVTLAMLIQGRLNDDDSLFESGGFRNTQEEYSRLFNVTSSLTHCCGDTHVATFYPSVQGDTLLFASFFRHSSSLLWLVSFFMSLTEPVSCGPVGLFPVRRLSMMHNIFPVLHL